MPDDSNFGKVPKTVVLYNMKAPPPSAFFTYECQFCFHYLSGKCRLVEGEISPTAWCTLWLAKNPFDLNSLKK